MAIVPDERLPRGSCWTNPGAGGGVVVREPGAPALGGSGGGCMAGRGGCDCPGLGGAPKVGPTTPGRGVAVAGGGVDPGLPGMNPGRGGGSGSLDGAEGGAGFAAAPAEVGILANDSAAAA